MSTPEKPSQGPAMETVLVRMPKSFIEALNAEVASRQGTTRGKKGGRYTRSDLIRDIVANHLTPPK